MRRTVSVLLVGLGVGGFGLAACGDDGGPSADDPEVQALTAAATDYANAFLSGDGEAAFGLLSTACQGSSDRAQYEEFIADLQSELADVEIEEIEVEELEGDEAVVTVRFTDDTFNAPDRPWVRESGGWRNDDCQL